MTELTETITAAVQYAETEWQMDVEPISAGTVGGVPWVCLDTGESTPIVILEEPPRTVATPIGLGDLTTEWWADQPSSLTAAYSPNQARAPRGTPIGGQWIDTPGALLDGLQSTGGGAGSGPAPAGVQDVVREQGGASLDPTTLTQPTDGYMVGLEGFTKIIPEDEFFGPGGEDALHAWIAERQEPLSQPGAHIGLWHDTETGNVVLDVSVNVKDKDEAIRLGQDGDQVSIWDVVNGEEIPTGGTGEGLRSSAYRMEHHDRSDTDGADPGTDASRRRGAAGLLRLGRGAPARVRAGGDRRAPAPSLTAGLGLGHNEPMASRFAQPPTVDVEFATSFNPAQARAPKGSPGGIGGEWIETVRGLLQLIGIGPNPVPQGKQLVESGEPLPRLFGDHDPVPPDGADKNGKPYGPDVVDAANGVYDRSAQQEPVVTRHVTESLEAGGMEAAGLAFRLKTPDSLARKIRDDVDDKGSAEAAAAGMFDVIRYTGVAHPAGYAQSSQGALDDLRAKGYQTVKVKNFWGVEDNPYRGINLQLLGPKGEQIELQFHTPESKDAALRMHPMFEEYRLMPDKSTPEAIRLNDEMWAISNSLESPPGVESIT